MINEESVLAIHAIGIFVFMFAPYFARTDAQRILYLQVMLAVTLQWVVLGGRCILTMLEHRLRSKENKGSDMGSGVWKRLSVATGIPERTWIAGHMMKYVVNTAVVSAMVGTRQARMLAAGSILMTILATWEWEQEFTQLDKAGKNDKLASKSPNEAWALYL